ncbi:MAG: hypothetical protein RLZZ364_672 [Actinomycetota bacterium]
MSASTGSYVSSTGGGGDATARCPNNGALSGIDGETTNYETTGTYRATLTRLTGACAAISADGKTITSVTNDSLGPYGGSGTALPEATCGTTGGTQVIVGARLYKTSTMGYAGGVTLLCGTLPLGTSRTFGASLGATSGNYEDIECAANSVATGLYVFYGGILDRFGITCAQIQGATQTITFSDITAKVLSNNSTTVTANSSSGLALSYSSSTLPVCTIAGTTISFVSSGSCSITASQSGNTTYAAANSVTKTFSILSSNPTVTTSNFDRDGINTGWDVAIGAGKSETVTVTGTNLSTCTAIVATGSGWTGSVSLTNVSDTNATFVAPSTNSFAGWAKFLCGGTEFSINTFLERVDAPTINGGLIPTITGTVASGQTLTATTGTWYYSPTSYSYQWKSSATSTGTYSNISGATLETYTLTANEVGLYIKVFVTATNVGGSGTSSSAASIQILRVSQTISITSLGTTSKTYPYSQALSITTSASGSGAKSYSVSDGTATGCALSSTTSATPTLTATTIGTCAITATIAQDLQYLTATSSATYFTFTKANQSSLSVSSLSGTYGTSLSLTTSGGSGTGGNTFSSTAGTTTCTVNAESLTASSAGNCYVTAVKAADANYLIETSTATLVTFARATQTLTISSIGTTSKSYPYSQILSIVTAGNSGSGSITFSVTDVTATGCALDDGSSSTPTITATSSGTCALTATIAQDLNYNSAISSAVNFIFSKANQALLTVSTVSGSFGTPLALSATGGSNSGSITYSTTAGTTSCTLNNGNLSAAGVGTCKVIATRAADANYTAVSSSETLITFARGQATASITFPAGTMVFRQVKVLTATTSAAGKVTFRSNGVLISGCRNLRATAGNSFQVTCSFRPLNHGAMRLSATFDPSNPDFIGTTTVTQTYYVQRRTGSRQ